MNKVIGFLLFDWRRKLLAVGIAFLIWSWVEGQISSNREVSLSLLVSGSDIPESNNLYLSVEVPDGWVLTEPSIGEAVPITLHGTDSEYGDFISRQCTATLSVDFEVDPIQDIVDYPITPKDLDWTRPSDAAFLLNGVKGGQQFQNLTFQRIQTKVLSPTAREVAIVGNPSKAHDAKLAEIKFLPSQITLTGPKEAMQKLTGQIDDAHSPTGSLEYSGLFASMTLSGNERNTVTKSLRLAEEWSLRGIHMEPEQILLELPVRLAQVKPFDWLPDVEDLKVLHADDLASRGPWTMEAYVPTQWYIERSDIESDFKVTQSWVDEHVVLLVPMNTLTEDSLDRTILPVKAHLFNFDNADEEEFFRKHLVIRAFDPESATVTVTRNP